jgi:hypothetical protein
MLHHFDIILDEIHAEKVIRYESIQALWSNYGEIMRLWISGGNRPSIVVKHIKLSNGTTHPKGWNTDVSHSRKEQSYAIENHWYQYYGKKCGTECRIPNLLGFIEVCKEEKLLILEDLDCEGYPGRHSNLNIIGAKVVLRWLANFHATFMAIKPEGLWKKGSYWHLETRQDEWLAMEEGWLKDNANALDSKLNSCQYQTIIHGDAKVANFCFGVDGKKVAAVDFQYVGGGCGMKDVTYFLGSCLSAEECENSENELINYYFKELATGLKKHHPTIDAKEVEKEYRAHYAIAWTDFSRFLKGWSPQHHKLNAYSKKLMLRAKNELGQGF